MIEKWKIITTETGSTYTIRDEAWWIKNDDPYWERVWWAYCINDEDFGSHLSYMADIPHLEIQIGKILYIGSKDRWWTSSYITKIEEIEHDTTDLG